MVARGQDGVRDQLQVLVRERVVRERDAEARDQVARARERCELLAFVRVGPQDLGLPDRRSARRGASRGRAVRRMAPGDERLQGAMRRQTALRLAATRGSVTGGELAAECGVSGEQARRDLVTLARLGLLRRVGGGRSTRYVLA